MVKRKVYVHTSTTEHFSCNKMHRIYFQTSMRPLGSLVHTMTILYPTDNQPCTLAQNFRSSKQGHRDLFLACYQAKFKQIVSLKTQFSPLKESVSFDGKIQCENKALQPN